MKKLLFTLPLLLVTACGATITEHTDAFGNIWKVDCSNKKYIIESVVGEDEIWGAAPMRTVQQRVRDAKAAGQEEFALTFGAAYATTVIEEACGK